MNILVDSSVWIDYFRGGKTGPAVDSLIEQNALCTNNLILAELVPFLKIKKQHRVIRLLEELENMALDIDWKKIIKYQALCLSNGINKVGIPDLIILDNVIRNGLTLFTLDSHFKKIKTLLPIALWG